MLSILLFWFASELHAPWWVFLLIALHLMRTCWSVFVRSQAAIHAWFDARELEDQAAAAERRRVSASETGPTNGGRAPAR